MTNYEKYQLQWMIDHDISLTDLIEDMFNYVHDEVDTEQPYSCGFIKEAFDYVTNEVGFSKNDMCFVCEKEWADKEQTNKRISEIQNYAQNIRAKEVKKNKFFLRKKNVFQLKF